MDSDDLHSMTILVKSISRKQRRARRRPIVVRWQSRPVVSVGWPLYVSHIVLN